MCGINPKCTKCNKSCLLFSSLKCLRSLYGKQCGPRSDCSYTDCSYKSSLFWVRAVCFYTYYISNTRQLFAADDFSRRYFQMHFFLGVLRVKKREIKIVLIYCAFLFFKQRTQPNTMIWRRLYLM